MDELERRIDEELEAHRLKLRNATKNPSFDDVPDGIPDDIIGNDNKSAEQKAAEAEAEIETEEEKRFLEAGAELPADMAEIDMSAIAPVDEIEIAQEDVLPAEEKETLPKATGEISAIGEKSLSPPIGPAIAENGQSEESELVIDVEFVDEPISIEIVETAAKKAKGYLLAATDKEGKAGYAYLLCVEDTHENIMRSQTVSNVNWIGSITVGCASLLSECKLRGITDLGLFARKSSCRVLKSTMEKGPQEGKAGGDRKSEREVFELAKDIRIDLSYQEEDGDGYRRDFTSMAAQFILQQ